MTVYFSPEAAADLDQQIAYMAAESPSGARRVADRLMAAIRNIETFPSLGRSGRVPGTREFPVPQTPLILVYRLLANDVEIVRLLHGSRRWP